jgi:hypothetical protein
VSKVTVRELPPLMLAPITPTLGLYLKNAATDFSVV